MTKIQNSNFKEFETFLLRIKEESTRKKIIFVEYVSIVLTVLSFFLSAYLAYEDYSMTAMAIAADSLLDILVHLTVIWRYIVPIEIDSKKRDFYSSLLLAILFLTSSFCIGFESAQNLVLQKLPVASLTFILIGVVQSILFCLLSIYKFYLANRISQNASVISSGIDSFITGLSSFSMALSMTIFVMDKKIWYLDSVFGIFIGCMVFIYGFHLIFTSLSIAFSSFFKK